MSKIVGEYHCEVSNQQELVMTYDSSKHYSFVTRVLDLKDVIFKFEVHVGSRLEESIATGRGFIQPVDLKGSSGVLEVCISDNVAAVGFLKVEYLLIKPLAESSLHDLGDWADRNWQTESRTLGMGHRGCGATFSASYDGVQENTIESFIKAYENGADGVELDVQATKDLQPVIYHDLNVKTLLQTKDGFIVPFMVPVHQLTYKELQQIQVEHSNSTELNRELQSRDDLHRKIFPTLKEVLTSLPIDFPMEIEVKYLETEKDKEDDPFIDVNLYVDSILKTVLENIGKRKIILMSFSPVIVQLMSRKQIKVPVKIGVCGETDKYPVYKDIRIRTLGMVVGFSHSERVLGVSCFCENVLTNPSIVQKIKEKNLILSTWGEDNNKHDVRGKQREMGINVLCYDRIHEVLPNERS